MSVIALALLQRLLFAVGWLYMLARLAWLRDDAALVAFIVVTFLGLILVLLGTIADTLRWLRITGRILW